MKKLLLAAIAVLVIVPAAATASDDKSKSGVRFATFNLSLNRSSAGLLVEHLSNPGVDDVFRRQARNNAEVIQRARPDVLLINEFDFAPQAVELFRKNFLEVSQNGAKPIHYRYAYIAPSNTGVATGFDLNNNGSIVTTPGAFGYGDDAFGFGAFPGQFGMVVYSKYPILREKVRTFQFFRWKDMPGALLPDDAATPAAMDWYNADELNVFRVSSKSHWDIPIRIQGKTVHFLASHPTPPVFDGPEDRNGKRNHDEIRLWADYISGGSRASYIYDDGGVRGGLEHGSRFVIAGDQNSDPLDGDSVPGAIQQLLNHPLVNTSQPPTSAGAVQASALQGGANTTHKGDPKFDTADFADTAPGNLRADYVLPLSNIKIEKSGVFWPLKEDPLFRLTGEFVRHDPPNGFINPWIAVGGFPTSDHRLVWVDTRLGGGDDHDDDDDD
jgi:Endonuclease/Exonuclease/phosphatase family